MNHFIKKYFFLFAIAIVLFSHFCACTKEIKETVYITDTIINNTPPSPVYPEYVITDYGAKGDGITDCSGVINSIINDKMPASGGTIVIPYGDFLLNNPIVVNRNFVTIKGLNPGLRSGVDVAVNNLVNPGGGSKLIIGSTSIAINVPVLADVNGRKNRISGLVVKNLLITGGSIVKGTGINIAQDNDGIRIEDVVGINLGTGIFANATDAMIIRYCWISECANSIVMPNGIQNMISNCQLGAKPGGITVKLDNQENFVFSNNHVYPDGDVNLQLNNSRYANISGNNFQSYYLGMLELNGSSNNLVGNNIFWMRLPSEAQKQLRGRANDYGVIRVNGNNNHFAINSIFCDWLPGTVNPVTIRSVSGNSNTYQSVKIADTQSNRVFYVNETTEILISVPSSKVAVDGDAANVTIKY